MWAEMLHSFYRMPAILYVAGVPTTVTLRWYKAPAGAKQLPFPSVIFSHVWDNNPGESQPGEIGEVGFPRTWDPGQNNGYQGQCYRGDRAWFATGQLPALPLPGQSCLCQIPPAQAAGALVLTGSASSAASVCQQKSSVVYVDPLDGTGPKRWTFAQAIGIYSVFTLTGGIPPLGNILAVGVPSAGQCITAGVAFFNPQPPPGHFVYSAIGALHYLFDAHKARWDFGNDGTVNQDVYTRVP